MSRTPESFQQEPPEDHELKGTPIATLGATVIDVNDLELEKNFWQWVVMTDPEGNEFCVSK